MSRKKRRSDALFAGMNTGHTEMEHNASSNEPLGEHNILAEEGDIVVNTEPEARLVKQVLVLIRILTILYSQQIQK